jgi:hypothetical protein
MPRSLARTTAAGPIERSNDHTKKNRCGHHATHTHADSIRHVSSTPLSVEKATVIPAAGTPSDA